MTDPQAKRPCPTRHGWFWETMPNHDPRAVWVEHPSDMDHEAYDYCEIPNPERLSALQACAAFVLDSTACCCGWNHDADMDPEESVCVCKCHELRKALQ